MDMAKRTFNVFGDGGASPEFSWRMAPHQRRTLARQLERAEDLGRHARAIADRYDRLITATHVARPARPPLADPVLARYPLFAADKPTLLERVRRARVEVSGWYATPIHPLVASQWASVQYAPGECPMAERNAGRIVSLPLGPRVSVELAQRISDFVNRPV
jgi:dTDP-4-amino-4,6-dideoxygalactose transaminase